MAFAFIAGAIAGAINREDEFNMCMCRQVQMRKFAKTMWEYDEKKKLISLLQNLRLQFSPFVTTGIFYQHSWLLRLLQEP